MAKEQEYRQQQLNSSMAKKKQHDQFKCIYDMQKEEFNSMYKNHLSKDMDKEHIKRIYNEVNVHNTQNKNDKVKRQEEYRE